MEVLAIDVRRLLQTSKDAVMTALPFKVLYHFFPARTGHQILNRACIQGYFSGEDVQSAHLLGPSGKGLTSNTVHWVSSGIWATILSAQLPVRMGLSIMRPFFSK